MKAPELIRRSRRLIWLGVAPFLHGGNRWTRKAARRQEPEFWLAHGWISRLRFKILRSLLRRRHSFRERLTATVVANRILRAIFFPVLLAAGAVVFLVWFDQSLLPALLDYLESVERAIPPESAWTLVEQALSWARAIAPSQPTEGAHAALLVTGAQVTGTFLGLYFAAISVVAGNAYGDVPPDLRSVLIEDPVGSFYLKVVGFTGGACLFGLGMLALGYSLGAGSAVVFALLGAASVLSFIKLGKRVFEFLDPEAVTSSLAKDIATAVNSVAGTGLLARDRSIQAHHQGVASRRLDAWDEMVSVSIGRSQSASALKNIGQNAVSLLRWYSEAKLPIPKESYWFERTLEHPSYLLVGGRNLTSALGAGVWMSPKMEPDQLWLEKRAGEIIQRVVVALLEKGSNGPCLEVVESLNSWIARSAHQLRVSQMDMGFQIARRIGSAARAVSAGASEGTDRDTRYGLAVPDCLARAIPHAAGFLYRRFGTLSLDQLLEDASKATIDGSLPLGEFPPRLRANIDSFRTEHSVERDIEGSIQTPSWFVQHHAARLLSVDLRTTFESLLNEAEQWLPSQAKSLREEGAVESAAMLIQRGLESVSKLETNAERTDSTLEKLKRRRVKTAGEEWPDVNPEQWKERLRVLRLALIKELVQLTPLLSTNPPRGDLPDSFGFAYSTLCDAMIDALKDMDATTFGLVYPILIPSALRAHDRVKTELAESSAENVLYFSTDVMLDVMDISGYAYLWKFSLGKERFWGDVTDVWDDLLSRYREPAYLITLIARGEDYHKQRFATSPRSEIRWQWRGRMRQLFEDKGFAPRNIVSRKLPNVIAIDPVASTYLQHWKSRKARDLMLSEYLLKRPEAGGIPLPRGVENLREGAKMVSDNRASGRVEGGPGFPGGSW